MQKFVNNLSFCLRLYNSNFVLVKSFISFRFGVRNISSSSAFQMKACQDEDVIASAKNKNSKCLSVESIYQKKTQLEHILLRPDSYIGTVEHVTQPMWVYNSESDSMVQRDISFVPGLYKIFDEILVNAADNRQRDSNMNCIKVDIKPEDGMIRIWNNGKGIPVVHHKVENVPIPTLIFGHLLTSSNYDDDDKKVVGGRNGYGAKLCNIFSSKFTVETSCREYDKSFTQTWSDNMTTASTPKFGEAGKDDFTCVTFWPDLKRFKMTTLDKDITELFARRAYDVAASTEGVRVFLNGKKLPVKSFKDYVDLYLKNQTDEMGHPLKVCYENCGERWEVAVATSHTGFQQVSFVNSIATTKGGRHVDHVVDQITKQLVEVVKKKSGLKSAVQIKPFQIKDHMWIFVRCLIENPNFDSQTKENMTLQAKSFGSTCSLSEKFFKSASKCGITDSVLSWMKYKAEQKMDKQCSKLKISKLKGFPKLDDANNAGTKNSSVCTLILTEGDSAKTLAVAGLSVIGRDNYGVFPLRGKVLNVREAGTKQLMENAEINALIKILGLQYKKNYSDSEALKTLRYGKIMIMTDQDQDGSHIKGLLINFIHYNWPMLLKSDFIEQFITPIVKVVKGKQELSFYSIPEFEEWKKNTANWFSWRIKYYKGLGTSTSKEAKDYFSDMARHRIRFRYGGEDDDAAIVLAFGKNNSDARKDWLTERMEERKRRVELGLSDLYLYGKDTQAVTYTEFVNRELILFSNMDNERSIPSLIDGMKPGQRKVLFTCFKRNLIRELKVAQLAGSVAELSAYHHGEVSLMGTIVGLAQNFVGSNNLNLLQPRGQFGTRLTGGKDSASPRYIFTCLSPLARLIFPASDDPLLKPQFDDNQRIEPEYYCPIIPMVLVNGAEGIGTGWSTRVLNYDVRQLIKALRDMLAGHPAPDNLIPSFKGFQGEVQVIEENRFLIHGEVAVLDDSSTIEITELPIRTWTQGYKESVLEVMLNGSDKVPAVITNYKEYHTDTSVRFVVNMSAATLAEAEAQGLHNYFKLSTMFTTNNMVLFDKDNCIRKYNKVSDILTEFFHVRMDLYEKRKAYMIGLLAAESLKLDNQARFVLEKVEGKIRVENQKRKVMIVTLRGAGYDPDPVHAWKSFQKNWNQQAEDAEAMTIQNNEENGNALIAETGDVMDDSTEAGVLEYDYIMKMSMWSLTFEHVENLCRLRDAKREELSQLRQKSPSQLWSDDLDALVEGLEKVEKAEKVEEANQMAKLLAKMKTDAKGRSVKRCVQAAVTLASPDGRRVQPRIDSQLRLKLENDKSRKVKAAEKKTAKLKIMDDLVDNNSDDDLPKPLAKRLSEKGLNVSPDINAVKKREYRTGKAKISKAAKPTIKSDSKVKSNSSGSGTSPKNKKKRNPWETDSEKDGSEETSDNSFDEEVSPQRTTVLPRRQAAQKVKYVVDDRETTEDEDVQFQKVNHSDGIQHNAVVDEVELPMPVAKPTKRKLLNLDKPAAKVAKTVSTNGRAGGRGRGRGESGAGRGKVVPKKNSLESSDSEDNFKKTKYTFKPDDNLTSDSDAIPNNKKKYLSDDTSSSDGEFRKLDKPVAKAAKTGATNARGRGKGISGAGRKIALTKKNSWESSDSDEESSKKTKSKLDDCLSDSDFIPKARPARQRAPVKYAFDISDDDSD